MHLCHYYEKSRPPFQTITSLNQSEAAQALVAMGSKIPDIDFFLSRRYELEKTVRDKFISRGGNPTRTAPIYFTLGENDSMLTWFNEPAVIKIPISEFDLRTVSFTYGDSLPVFNPKLNTGEEWWGNVYFYDEIVKIIEKFGYPENPEYHMLNCIFPKDKSIRDYLKYVEAHVWSDDVLKRYSDLVN